MDHISDDITNPGRRDFFLKIALASLATSIPTAFMGCGDNSEFRGVGEAPYKIWEEILYHLRSSPDHLKGRMQQLIMEGDPEAMFNFVRDEFYLIPQYTKSIGYGDAFKWGVNYALRSGMATAREKAELLHQMFQEAEIPSKVVQERTAITPEEAQSFFFRPIKRQFAPRISKSMLRRWAKEMGMNNSIDTEQGSTDSTLEKADALAKRIWEGLELPEDYYFGKFALKWDNYRTPTVEFEWEQQTRYAHLFDPKVPFGALRSDKTSNIGKAAEIRRNEDNLRIKVSYRDSITPKDEKELISGEWLATEVVGRQLNIGFINGLSLEEKVVTPIGNIRTFTPTMALQAIGESPKYMAERSVLADPITLEGKRIYLNTEGAPPKIGNSILLDKPNPELQKKVQALEIKAKTTGYPGVKLSVSPLDSEGELIEGLSARDFQITEDGKPVRALMESNQCTPRILIMSDGSGSMPSEYRGKGMKDFVANLKTQILKTYPAAIIDHWITPSSMYTWLLKAAQTENDLVIFATDGHNRDKFNIENEALYRSGPPAIILNVNNSKTTYTVETFEKMAALTKGVHLSAADQPAAMESIVKYLADVEIQPYIFTYNSVGTEENRLVNVAVDKNRVSSKTVYQTESSFVPSQIGPAVIGLYLEIKYSNQYVIRRALAGWEQDVQPSAIPSAQMALEVNDLMLGGIQMYFEGSGPTYSAALSDLLKTKLSTRKWGEAVLKGEIEQAKKRFQEGGLSISGKALTFMSPLTMPATSKTFSFPGGLRIGMETFKPGFMTGKTKVQFDYLPTSEYNTVCNDRKTSFKTTLQKTAQLAIREHGHSQRSTHSELDSKNWINIAKARKEKWFYNQRDSEDRYWSERVNRGASLRLFDVTATSRAFWNIDVRRGELFGILPNGSGGTDNSYDNEAEAYANYMEGLLNLMAVIEDKLPEGVQLLNPIGAFSLGIVALYGKTLIKLYGIASEAIMIMDASFVNEQIARALAQFACEVAKRISDDDGTPGITFGGLEKLIAMIAPKDGPFSC